MAYAHWHLGLDDEASEHTKARYKYPYGDFGRVHRCGLLAAEVRAGRYRHSDIEDAAIRLREMLDGRGQPASQRQAPQAQPARPPRRAPSEAAGQRGGGTSEAAGLAGLRMCRVRPPRQPGGRGRRPAARLSRELAELTGGGTGVTIVVGVDGSAASRVALRQAAQEARWRNASLVAVAAYEVPLGVPPWRLSRCHPAHRERKPGERRDGVAQHPARRAR